MRRFLVLASAILLLAVLIVAWLVSRRPQPVALTPTLTGQVEYCLTCHSDLGDISPSHPTQTFGCVLCHGGERLALEADLAHSTLRGGSNPSDFSVVQASCGGADCHSGAADSYSNHIQRATTSIQATYAGAIAMIRYTFGAQPDLNARFGIYAVEDPQSASGITSLAAFDPSQEAVPSVQAFGQNCLTCHLSAPPLAGSEYERFTGCAACHTPFIPTPLPMPALSTVEGSGEGQVVMTGAHKLTTAISYTQCNTCHNRGNYDLRTMTFQPRQDLPATGTTSRLQTYYQPIAQFTKCEYTLDCVDCHTRTEAMGDGSLYSSKFQIQYIRCKTCHGTLTELPQTRTLTDPNDLSFRMALLNPVVELKPGDTILVTENNEPLWNTRALADGTYQLVGKATGQTFTFKPVMGSGCPQDPNEQSSSACHQCHSVQR